MNFAEKITLLRNLKGLSKRQVGDAIGTSDVSIHRYENGVKPKRPEIYEKLARFFGCTVKELTDDSVDILPKDLQEKKEPEKDNKKVSQKPADEKQVPAEKEKKAPTEEHAPAKDESPEDTFSEKLSSLRVDNGLGQREMAEKLGVTLRVYRRMENKNERPETIEIYENLAEILGCKVAYLTDGDERFSPQKDVDELIPVPAVPESKPFGKRLNVLRKAKNLTLVQAADKVGITQSAYKSMEYRDYRPRDIKVYNKLAKVLGCDAEYLKEGDKRFEKKPDKKVVEPKKKAEKKSEVPADVVEKEPAPVRDETKMPEQKAPQPADPGEIEENIPIDSVEKPAAYTKSSAGSEVIKLVSRLSVLLAGDEISKSEKDAVMVALNGAYWK